MKTFRALARQIAGKCDGLPLALNVIGETMSCKTRVQEWRRAIDVLTLSAADFAGVEDEILPILKFSYDSLNGEVVKSCFLYCSLFPEDYFIEKEKLIDYWICEGFIDERGGRERAINQVYEILGTLVRACLLLEGESYVVMHDVVREMAIWIASDPEKHKEIWIVQAPKVKNWRDVRKISCICRNIENISGSPEFPELTTFLLQENASLVHISDEFFKYIPTLVVLDLSWIPNLSELPKHISKLISLRYLDLSRTGLKRFQVGLQELKKLVYLNLEHTEKLECISGISNLSCLRTLRLEGSRTTLDMSLLKELQLVEYLEFLTIEISSGMVWEQLLSSHRLVNCIRNVGFRGLKESVRVLTLPTTCDLRRLTLEGCRMGEIKIERTISSLNNSPTIPCFSNRYGIYIGGCNHLKDLAWLVFAPNLVDLKVGSSNQLDDIINEEKATSVTGGHAGSIVPFQKLRRLWLSHLPMLKSIYWSPLPFPCINKIIIEDCPKLRKLPLGSESVVSNQELIIEYDEEEWIKEVAWEDEATQLRFLPSCKLQARPPPLGATSTSTFIATAIG